MTVQRDLTFAAGTIEGDMQCIAVPILDNTRPDGTRAFLVRIVSFTPFIRALPFPKLVIIRDDDSKHYNYNTACCYCVFFISFKKLAGKHGE